MGPILPHGLTLLHAQPQITLSYSRCGLTIDINNFGSIVLSNAAKERLINPKTEFAFFIAADVWLWNFNFWSVITPKSFISFTFSITWSFIWYDLLVLSLPICIHLHFSSLKGNCQNAAQSTKLSISSCNDVVSSSVIIVRYNFVSSANILQLFFITNGKSFMNITKRVGPSTDPWLQFLLRIDCLCVVVN